MNCGIKEVVEPLNSRTLLIGGAGFVGQYVQEQLPNTVTVDPNGGDISRPLSAVTADDLPPIDHVIHMAHIPPGETAADTEQVAANTAVTQEVLALADAVAADHFTYVSSGAVYAGQPPHHETDELETPVSAYGRSKQQCEQLVQNAAIPAAIVRPANVYGYRDCGVVNAFFHWALNNQLLTVHGRETARDFVYVEDVAELVATVSRQRERVVVNAGTGTPTTLHNLATHIIDITGSDADITVREQVDSRQSSYLATERASTYRSEWTPLADGLRRMHRALLNNTIHELSQTYAVWA